MSHAWQERQRPERLERRYEFDGYDALRDYLDLAAGLSENADYYPDMGFGKDYVNITIHVDEGCKLEAFHRDFAKKLEALFEQLDNQS